MIRFLSLRSTAIVSAIWFLVPVQAAQAAPQDREELEDRFSELLSGARLVGSFTDDANPDAPPQRDSYTIASAEKIAGDRWQFQAKIEYGQTSLVVPLALDVKWAGSTPVITLDEMAIPGLGTFTARVLFHGRSYAGIWQGPGHGGQMFGRVLREDEGEGTEEEQDEPKKDEQEEQGGQGGDRQGVQDGDRRNQARAGEIRASAVYHAGEATSSDWPSFRGPDASGIAEGHELPVEWDVESGENIRWKTAIPGLAHSSPVIHGSRLFVCTAVREGAPAELKVGLYGDPSPVGSEGPHEFAVLCLDKGTGDMLWKQVPWKGTPKFSRHPKSSYAASTPATDGKHLVVNFGTEGLYGFDVDGKQLWKVELGDLDAGPYNMRDVQWGYASSPVIHGDRVLVQCDALAQGFVAAFDVESGRELWRTKRDEVSTWCTPTVDVRPGRSQVICNGYKHIGGYALESGKELWKLAGGGDAPVPAPVVAHDLVFITNAHGRLAPIYAILADAEGELDPEHEQMAWYSPNRGNYMQTPLVYGEELYCCSDSGILACYDVGSGESHYRERLGSGDAGFTASMIAGDGKLYATSEEGSVHVIAAGTTYEHLATNEMGETCMASPAASAGVLYWRTRGHVVAVGGDAGR